MVELRHSCPVSLEITGDEFTEDTISAEYGNAECVFEYAESQCREDKEQIKAEKDFNFRFERNSMQYDFLFSELYLLPIK